MFNIQKLKKTMGGLVLLTLGCQTDNQTLPKKDTFGDYLYLEQTQPKIVRVVYDLDRTKFTLQYSNSEDSGRSLSLVDEFGIILNRPVNHPDCIQRSNVLGTAQTCIENNTLKFSIYSSNQKPFVVFAKVEDRNYQDVRERFARDMLLFAKASTSKWDTYSAESKY